MNSNATWFITYRRDFAPPGYMSLLIMPQDESQLILTAEPFGVRFQNPSEIGVYQLELDAELCTELRDLAEAAQNDVPETPVAVPPGARLLVFGIGEKETLDDTVAFPAGRALPKRVETFDERMQTVAEEIKAHRYQTLRAAAAWQSQEFSPKEELKFSLSLENSGIVPVGIPNPAAANNDDEVGLVLFLQSELPPDQVPPEGRAFFPLKKGEVSQIAAPGWQSGTPPERLVTLDPGQRLELAITVRRHLYLMPGPYSGNITFEAEHDKIPEHLALEGSVRTQIGTFQITSATGKQN